MKINLVVTEFGFSCATDEDKEQKKSLKRGSIVECTIKEYRNYKFHRLYFCMINVAWEYLTEEQQAFFYNNKESFRKSVEIAAGHCEQVYNRTRNEWLDIPKSIAFDKMTEAEFHSLYERVRDVLYRLFIPEANKKDFEEELKYF